jgi:hypothetical protein
VTVTSGRQIPAVVDDDDPWFAALSPSGAMLAYYSEEGRGRDAVEQLCIFTFESAGKACHALPEAFNGYPYQLAWSPDDATIAFSENPIELALESDVWTLDVASGAITDLTDDGLGGSSRDVPMDGSAAIDYLPFWHPTDGSLLFWRLSPLGDSRFDLGIYRIEPGSTEAAIVRDVGADVPSRLPVFQQERFFLDGPSALSPDGSTVAALLSTIDATGMTVTDLWTIGLDGGPVVQLATQEAIDAAVPEWQPYPTAPLGLSWTAAGDIVVFSFASDTHNPFMVLHHVDPDTGTLTPVVDFSGLATPEAYMEPATPGGLPWRVYSPWTATLSPSGDTLLMVQDLTGVMAMMVSPLPPDGSLPQFVASTDSAFSSTASRSSRSADGKVTVYGLLLSIAEG